MPLLPNPKRRNPQSHQAILDATVALLAEEGYAHMSIEAIARRAGVSKKTIYRWWSSKAAVVMEAYMTNTAQEILVPDTGSIQKDLEQLFTQVFKILTTTPAGAAMSGIMVDAQTDPAIAQLFREQFIVNRRLATRQILERGIARGELQPDCDIECAIDTLYGPMWYRLLVGHQPLNSTFAQTLVKQVLAGIEKVR